MVRVIAFLAATTALAGCAARDVPPPVVAAPAEAPPAAPAAPAAPKPQYGTFGFDTAGMNSSVQPGADFYEYANGTWAKTTPIPADRSNYGMFTMLEELSNQRTREILEEQARSPRIGSRPRFSIVASSM